MIKSDGHNPSWEIHCLGRMAIMPGSRHRKGDPIIVVKDGTTEPFTLDETEQTVFEEYQNSICIRYGLNPYLGNGNGDARYSNNNDTDSRYKDSTPLNNEIIIINDSEVKV